MYIESEIFGHPKYRPSSTKPDLPAKLHLTVRLFADNTISYLVIESPEDATLLLEDLVTLSEWEEQWRMKELVLLRRAISLKVDYKKVNFQTGFFAITLVIINGHTCVHVNYLRCSKQGQWGDKYSLT